jgi:uncharacterized protein (TIGR00251 family)
LPAIPDIKQGDGFITFPVLVAPRASRPKLGPVVGDRIKIAVTAPPVEGKANAAVVDLLAKKLGISKQGVQILSGSRGKRKMVRVEGVSRRSLLDCLNGGS